MKRLASKLVVPVASAVLGVFATLAACLPDDADPDHPIMPIGGPPVSSGTGGGDNGGGGGGGGDNGFADAGVDFGDGGGGGFGDGGVGFGDGGVGFGDGGVFGDVGTIPLDAFDPAADGGGILIPSDGGGAPPFPEGDQIP